MSHLAEEYAKNLEAKITKPQISPHFFPIKYEKYITLDVSEEAQSKSYPHFDIVLKLIKKHLDECGIKVIQIGGKKTLDNIDQCLDLDFKKTAYVISKSSLHIGPDNHFSQYASSKEVNTVTLFGNSFPANTKPYWGNCICLEPEWEGKPCYSDFDPLKNVSKIKVEDVSNSILKSLGFSDEINFKTIHVGGHFNDEIVEVIPTKKTNIKKKNIFIRADYGFKEDVFLDLCSRHQVDIISDKPIDVEFFKDFQGNVNSFSLVSSMNDPFIPLRYFEILSKIGIEVVILCKEKEGLGKLRNHYFDIAVQPYYRDDHNLELNPNNLFFTKKMLVEGDKVYPSLAHYKKNIDKEFKVLDDHEYRRESEHFFIYEQN